MSISYYGVKTPDRKRVWELVENGRSPGIAPIDVAELHRRLIAETRLRGTKRGVLRWADSEGFVSVDITPGCALITDKGGFGEGFDVLFEVFRALRTAGLSVFDPQQNTWMGSPVKPTKPTKPVKPTKPTKPVKPTKPTKPTKAERPVKAKKRKTRRAVRRR